MDAALQHAWLSSSPPFNGVTLRTEDLVRLERLSQLLSTAIVFLREEFGDASLLQHADWHEHDGYITSSAATDWNALANLVASPETLYEQRRGEDFVRIGVYEGRGGFYLRIWVPEDNDDPEEYPGRWGSFDVSAAEPVVVRLNRALGSAGLVLSNAKPYFDQRSA
jgi:hypothetical protein